MRSFFVSTFFQHYLHGTQASQLSFYIYAYQPLLYTYLHDDDDDEDILSPMKRNFKHAYIELRKCFTWEFIDIFCANASMLLLIRKLLQLPSSLNSTLSSSSTFNRNNCLSITHLASIHEFISSIKRFSPKYSHKCESMRITHSLSLKESVCFVDLMNVKEIKK